MPSVELELAALAEHLAHRRPAILRAWRKAVKRDPGLTSGTSLPRAQLQDHIPALLLDFEQRLTATGSAQASGRDEGNTIRDADAAAHGLLRWQQGFDLEEVTRELSQLNEIVVAELDRCALALPDRERTVMPLARKIWAQQHGETIGASTSQYFRLQQLEANSHIRDLEHAVATLRELEQHRALLWRQAAHDLRGNVGVVANATAALTSGNASELARRKFMRVLDRNVSSLRLLLDDVTALARLQGGQEHRNSQPMDAAAVLRQVCEGMQMYAQEASLFLSCDGPASLWVEGDAVKTSRITQNLVLNAIKYTRRGGVTVSWGGTEGGDTERWFVQVQDTGPGIHAESGSTLAGALEEATEQAKQVETGAEQGEVAHAVGKLPEAHHSERHDPREFRQNVGEGIGLSIVKRLCELLDATLEVESKLDEGTTFRILLPRGYVEQS
jgi:signal transduction histidine kinase